MMYIIHFRSFFTENIFELVNTSFIVINGNPRTCQKCPYLKYSFSLHEKCSNLEFFWSAVSNIRLEYGDLYCKLPNSVLMRENKDQKKLRIRGLFAQRLLITLPLLPLLPLLLPLLSLALLQIRVIVRKSLFSFRKRQLCTPTYLRQRDLYWWLFLELRRTFLGLWLISYLKLPHKKAGSVFDKNSSKLVM